MQNRSLSIVADRSPRDAAVAMGAAWLAFLAALPFFESGGVDLADMLIGGLIGAGLVVAGYAAAWRLRPIPPRQGSERLRLALLAIARQGFSYQQVPEWRLPQEITGWGSLETPADPGHTVSTRRGTARRQGGGPGVNGCRRDR
jgi:hypothetical protein